MKPYRSVPSDFEPRTAALEAKLRLRAAQLRSEMKASLHPGNAVEAGLAEPLAEVDDEPVAALARELEGAAVERDGTELRQVEEALARIAAGTYGLCTECGATIGAARLEALPHASRCIACESRAEQAKGRPAAPSL